MSLRNYMLLFLIFTIGCNISANNGALYLNPPFADVNDSTPDCRTPKADEANKVNEVGSDLESKEPGLTKVEIESQIRASLDEIKMCYTNYQSNSTYPSGRLTVLFVIASDGLVDKVSYDNKKSTLKRTPFFSKCVFKKMCLIKYPRLRTGGAIEVSYPFVFNGN